MKLQNHGLLAIVYSTLIASALSGNTLASEPANWSNIPVKTIKLFYPGQSKLPMAPQQGAQKGK